MNEALETLFTDLIAAGVALPAARDARRLYALALNRRGDADWVAFYRAVFAALQGRQPVRASLLLLLEDDLGSTLFSRSETEVLRSPREPAVVHGGRTAARWQSLAYERI